MKMVLVMTSNIQTKSPILNKDSCGLRLAGAHSSTNTLKKRLPIFGPGMRWLVVVPGLPVRE